MSGFKFSFLPTETDSSAAGGDTSREIDEARRCDGAETEAPAAAPVPRLTEIDVGAALATARAPPSAWRSARVDLAPGRALRRIAVADRPFAAVASTDRPPREDDGADRPDAEGTDLIPGQYEGGLKVWECSLDLCRHLLTAPDDVAAALGPRGSTLELGCGHGLPACLVLQELLRVHAPAEVVPRCDGAASPPPPDTEVEDEQGPETPDDDDDSGPVVVFTDYNEFVLKDATLPNIVLNCTRHDARRSVGSHLPRYCRLFAGDWWELSRWLADGALPGAAPSGARVSPPRDGRFDLILAAETTYSPEAARATARLLLRHLRPGAGVGLVATKRYYFGVGGGSAAFREAARKARGAGDGACGLTVELAREFDDGVSNVRDLWRVRCVREVDERHNKTG